MADGREQDRLTVYYDSLCLLCTSQAARWRRSGALDKGLELVPLDEAPATPGGPSRDDLRAVIHVRSGDRWLKGAKALRAVYQALGNRPMAALLSVGLGLGLADPLYAILARYRMHIPVSRRARPQS